MPLRPAPIEELEPFNTLPNNANLEGGSLQNR
jgi:hypothetical protein